MSETYQSKRERWQRMLEALPVGLREYVSLRNVEAVAALTPKAQQRLVEAIQAGLKRLPRAVEQLRVNPDTSVADLLDSLSRYILRRSAAKSSYGVVIFDTPSACGGVIHFPVQPDTKPMLPSPDFSQHIEEELANLIQSCFPDMPLISAKALANADVMDVARSVAEVHSQIFKSHHMRTDFVMMVLYGLIRQTLERLEEVIEDTPALRQVFAQSSLPWKPNDWRKGNA